MVSRVYTPEKVGGWKINVSAGGKCNKNNKKHVYKGHSDRWVHYIHSGPEGSSNKGTTERGDHPEGSAPDWQEQRTWAVVQSGGEAGCGGNLRTQKAI